MNIALDWDGTVTHDLGAWCLFAKMFAERGHKVYIVTMRKPDEAEDLHPILVGLVESVIFTSRRAKRPFVKEIGLHIHIWIDDNPEAVLLSAQEVWKYESPTGHIIDPTLPPPVRQTYLININACVNEAFKHQDPDTFYHPIP